MRLNLRLQSVRGHELPEAVAGIERKRKTLLVWKVNRIVQVGHALFLSRESSVRSGNQRILEYRKSNQINKASGMKMRT